MSEKNIPLPTSPVARVIKVNFALRCNFGHEWGVTLRPDLEMPLGWDTCLKCEREKNINKNGRSDVGSENNAPFSNR